MLVGTHLGYIILPPSQMFFLKSPGSLEWERAQENNYLFPNF